MKSRLSRAIALALTQGIWCGLFLSGMVVRAGMPDLVVSQERLASSVAIETRAFGAGDCSVVEACAPAGERKLLLFDTGFMNAGDGDLVIGDPTTRPDLFEFSPCHGHYHMHGMANYEVVSSSGQTVLRARKQGFCLRDNAAFDPAAGPAKYTCDYQGLTVGWEDIYDKSLDCQWLDITGLAGGNYVLKVSVNPEQAFQEGNHDNNTVMVPITIPGDGGTNGGTNVICKIKTRGRGFITVPETGKCFHFDFKFQSWNGETKGHFWAFEEESGVCITGLRVTKIEQVDDQTVLVELDAKFGAEQEGAIKILVRDSGKWWECDSFEITLEEGVSISGTVGHACRCDWGHVKVDIKCKERCKGGAYCKGHPHCDEHPYCKGKKCKGHKDCADRDDDDDSHDGDDDDDGGSGDHDDDDGDDDGGHKCNGHPECKEKCKGKRFCKGHPRCDEHPFCEVPNCKGHKKCKKENCTGHPECRKQYKHKKGCKAKVNAKHRCSCKTIKR